ncbi:LBF_2804 family protein [Flavitalea flava]
MSIEFKERKISPLERFGVYYLNLFRKKDLTHHVFDFSDEQLTGTVNRISAKGMILSALVGLICVWPTVYIAILKQQEPWYSQYTWVGIVTLLSIIVEFYLLFLIALKAVHEVSELINMHAHAKDFLQSGPFSITHILSRAALELPDPEMHILGIDPFKRVSKKNLLLLGLLYKCKIVLTNFAGRWILTHLFGPTIGGISINYIALPVECFWNALVIRRVVKEARLRLFGFALCNHVADHILQDRVLNSLSEPARIGCLRAIGNAVILARNYHPNMIVLLLRFQHLLHMRKDHRYDDWSLFLETLQSVEKKERFFLLNLFTIALAFDGRISRTEADNMKDAYGPEFDLYRPRLMQLTGHLHTGRLNAAADLCKTDFTAG